MNAFPEFDDLPDDPEVAFVRLHERYDKELQEKINNEQDGRIHYVEFMNSMIAVARGLDIDGFDEWTIPEDWDDIYPTYVQFDRAVKRYAMEVKVRKSRVTKVYSVELDQETKDRIHTLARSIREHIEKAELEPRKKNSLLAKLNAFEADVDRHRTRFENAMAFSIDIINTAKKAGDVLTPVNELLRRIQEIMGAAKEKDPEQQQLPPPAERKKLEPPRKRIEGPKRDLDDEIPF